MAKYLPEQNILFLHMPRTGGTWVEEAFNVLNIDMQHVGRKHGTLYTDKEIFDLYSCKHPMIFTFIKHPVNWYISNWRLRMQNYWQKNIKTMALNEHFETEAMWHPAWFLDNCLHEDINVYLKNIIENCPGYFTNLVKLYTHRPPTQAIDFIGKSDEIPFALSKALSFFKIPHDKNFLMTIGDINRSIAEPGLIDETLVKQICEIESKIIQDHSLVFKQ